MSGRIEQIAQQVVDAHESEPWTQSNVERMGKEITTTALREFVAAFRQRRDEKWAAKLEEDDSAFFLFGVRDQVVHEALQEVEKEWLP